MRPAANGTNAAHGASPAAMWPISNSKVGYLPGGRTIEPMSGLRSCDLSFASAQTPSAAAVRPPTAASEPTAFASASKRRPPFPITTANARPTPSMGAATDRIAPREK